MTPFDAPSPSGSSTSERHDSEGPVGRVAETAGALVIGGELLTGKIRDENTYSLAKTLRALGIRLERVIVVPDDRDVIAEELRRLRAGVDVVFTSGGVGPTHDDVSVEGVALALGRRVVESPRLIALVEKVYGDSLTEAQRLLARVPEGAELLETSDIRWPTVVCDSVWMLPGVPELFRMKLAAVRVHLRGPHPLYGLEVLSSADEVSLKERIDQVVRNHPHVEIGSYPKWFDRRFKTRLTFDGTNEQAVLAAAAEFRHLLGDDLVEADALG